MEKLVELVVSGGIGGAVGVAVAYYLFKKALDHALARDIEDYKTRLSHQSEIHKLQLEKQALEHDVRFRHLHERCAKSIEECFVNTSRLYGALLSYFSILSYGDDPDRKRDLEAVGKAYEAFSLHINEHRLFLPNDLYVPASQFGTEVFQTVMTFRHLLEKFNKGIIETDGDDHWDVSRKAMKEKITPLFEQIHADFQKFLGME